MSPFGLGEAKIPALLDDPFLWFNNLKFNCILLVDIFLRFNLMLSEGSMSVEFILVSNYGMTRLLNGPHWLKAGLNRLHRVRLHM